MGARCPIAVVVLAALAPGRAAWAGERVVDVALAVTAAIEHTWSEGRNAHSVEARYGPIELRYRLRARSLWEAGPGDALEACRRALADARDEAGDDAAREQWAADVRAHLDALERLLHGSGSAPAPIPGAVRALASTGGARLAYDHSFDPGRPRSTPTATAVRATSAPAGPQALAGWTNPASRPPALVWTRAAVAEREAARTAPEAPRFEPTSAERGLLRQLDELERAVDVAWRAFAARWTDGAPPAEPSFELAVNTGALDGLPLAWLGTYRRTSADGHEARALEVSSATGFYSGVELYARGVVCPAFEHVGAGSLAVLRDSVDELERRFAGSFSIEARGGGARVSHTPAGFALSAPLEEPGPPPGRASGTVAIGFAAAGHRYALDWSLAERSVAPDELPAPSGLRFLVQTADGLVPAERVATGLAHRVEVRFDAPASYLALPVRVAAGGAPLDLLAAPHGADGLCYRSPAFVPASIELEEQSGAGAGAAAPLAGRWRVSYGDAALGVVEGAAVAEDDGRVRVRLVHPRTGAESELISTAVRAAGSAWTIELSGRSPFRAAAELPDISALAALEVAGDALEARSQGRAVRAQLAHVALADNARVVVELGQRDDGSLAGEWRYRADPRTGRERDGEGRVGHLAVVGFDPLTAEQRGCERWAPLLPRIDVVVVVEDQEALEEGVPRCPYPYQGGREGQILRHLFVAGANLPARASDPLRLEALGSTHVSYAPYALAADEGGLDPAVAAFAEAARARARRAGVELAGRDWLLLRVRLAPGVLAGEQRFALDGAEGRWRLAFGDDDAALAFVRETGPGEREPTRELFVPETFRVRVTTAAAMPFDALPLALRLGDEPPRSLVARRDAASPRVYLGPEVELERAVDGELVAELDATGLLSRDPPPARARAYHDPAVLSAAWRKALERAARCAGIEAPDLTDATLRQVEEITNRSLSNTGGGVFERLSIGVKLGDHAAMLLLRDAFAEACGEELAALERIDAVQGGPRAAALLGFGALIEPFVSVFSDHPLSRVRVAGPGAEPGATVPAWAAFEPDAALAWRVHAFEELLRHCMASSAAARASAAAVDACDVAGLLALTGYGFDAVVERLLPRLMARDGRGRFVPDRVARAFVANLHVLGSAARAQADLARADTDRVLITIGLATLPAGAFEAALARGIAALADLGFNALGFFGDADQYLRWREEVAFARDAAQVLGAERLRESEARAPSALELLLSGVGVAAPALGLAGELSDARQAAALVARLERGGLEAVQAMSDAERAALGSVLADAFAARGAGRAPSSTHARALAAYEREVAELRRARQKLQQVGVPDSPLVERFRRASSDGERLALVLELQRSTADMRALKYADEQTRRLFNQTLYGEVYDAHDAAVVQHVLASEEARTALPELGRLKLDPTDPDIRVHDFRTPGANDLAASINTDRDYRVIFRLRDEDGALVLGADGQPQWIEVPREHWERASQAAFAERTGFDPARARELLPAAQRAQWDALSREQQRERWAELHQQLATDKMHVEASADFSDQVLARGGQVTPNVVKVRAGEGQLLDPQGLGLMYEEKASIYLRQDNPLEALAQLNKGLEMLGEVRAQYRARGLDPGFLPERFQAASLAVSRLHPYDASKGAERVAALLFELRRLGFDGLEGLIADLRAQLHVLCLVPR